MRPRECQVPAGVKRYGAILRAPGARTLVIAGSTGRLPLGMAPLAIVLAVRQAHGSYALAGLLAAAHSVGLAAAAPVLGRLIDRFGQARVLAPVGLVLPVAASGLAASIAGRSGVGLTLALAAVTGASAPPLGACVRALWPKLLRSADLRDSAYAFEATVQETVFVVGPLLVALVVSLSSPSWALIASGACGCVGALAYAAAFGAHATRSGPAGPRGGVLRPPGIRTVLLTSVALGAAFGAIEVTMPSFAEANGSRSGAGLILAAISLGSVLGGLWWGARARSETLGRRYLIALAGFCLALLPALLAGSLTVMVAAGLLIGFPIAPSFGAAYVLLGNLAAPRALTETFAWISTSIIVGAGAGTALGGAIVHGLGWSFGLALAVGCASVALIVATLRRATLAGVAPSVRL